MILIGNIDLAIVFRLFTKQLSFQFLPFFFGLDQRFVFINIHN